jgi:hypothetical protein
MTDCRSLTRVSVSVSRRRTDLVDMGEGPSTVLRGTLVGVLSFIGSSGVDEAFASR